MAIENVGGRQCSLCRQERECHFFAEYQELLGVVLEFYKRFCGSGERSLVPNIYPKSFCHETEFRFHSTWKQNSVSTAKVEKVSHLVFTTKK
jgi:hypothetical protein